MHVALLMYIAHTCCFEQQDKAEHFAGRKRRRVEYETTQICHSEYSTGANHSKIGLPYLYGAYRDSFVYYEGK